MGMSNIHEVKDCHASIFTVKLFYFGLNSSWALKWSAMTSKLVCVPTEITRKRGEAINQSGQFLIKQSGTEALNWSGRSRRVEKKKNTLEDHYLMSLATQAFTNSEALTANYWRVSLHVSTLERDFAHCQYPNSYELRSLEITLLLT